MAIDDANTIDALGIEPETGTPLLIISDHLDWSDPVAHLNTLQQKIGAYLGFIQSGQLEQQLPQAAGRTPKIGVIMQFEPTEEIVPVLAGLGAQLATLSVDFGYGPLPEGIEAD
jgi:hypothetical protein